MKPYFRQVFLNSLSLIGLATIAALSLVFYFSMKQFHQMNQMVSHTQETIETAYDIQSGYFLLEALLRAYVLTGENQYQEDFKANSESIVNNINKLKQLVADNPDQIDRISLLQALINSRIADSNFKINLRKSHSLEYTLNYLTQKQFVPSSKFLSIQISKITKTIIGEEKKLLSSRNTVSYKKIVSAHYIGSIANIISVIFIVLSLIFLNRQLLKQYRIEKKLDESAQELVKLAYSDALTGLHNRNRLLQYIRESIQSVKSETDIVALLYLDLDNFKMINDTYGHEVGDHLLKSVANRLLKIPYKNKFVARISGDEFAIVLTHLNKNDLAFLSQNILNTINSPIKINGQDIFTTACIGVSTYPHSSNDGDSLIKNADIAMYKGKELGKNNYQFNTHEMNKEFIERTHLHYHLQKAVMNNEFIMMYQPKLSLKTEKPTGVEALIRWSRPEGLIYPNKFISLAENNGLIIQIGEWVLKTICIQTNEWKKSGIEIKNIAINISIRELMTRNFIDVVKKIIEDNNFDPSILEVEITESSLLEKSAHNITALKNLKSLGIKITIDDFGTGYSSLSYLNLFPIDKLKIDQSFVAKITQENKDDAIIGAIISLAHNLGIKVVAEGVENEFQLNILKQYRCDEIQGFHYSQPLSADEISHFFSKHIPTMKT